MTLKWGDPGRCNIDQPLEALPKEVAKQTARPQIESGGEV